MILATSVSSRIAALPHLTDEDMDAERLRDLLQLTEHSGFAVLFGLLLASRQGKYAMLANAPLTDHGRYNAAVIQGQIKGIEEIGATVIAFTDNLAATIRN